MKKYHYTDAKGDQQGPYSIEQLTSLKDLRVIGTPSPIWDETTTRTTTLGELLAVGPKVVPLPPIIPTTLRDSSNGCKICGAARDPLAAQCKFCGTAYKLEKLTGEVYISALQNLLAKIDERSSAESDFSKFMSSPVQKAQPKITAISTFAMPSDIENLMQFFAFCHGNAQMTVGLVDHSGERLTGAWQGKAKMAFTQIKMKAITNPNLTPYIAEYEPLYGVNAKKPLSNMAKLIIIGLCISVLMLLPLIVGKMFGLKDF